MKNPQFHISFVLITLTSCSAFAQSNISTVNKFSWGENIGWMNWRDAGNPLAAQGATIGNAFLSGFIWCENVGYLNLGDGSPVNGAAYTNSTGLDSGVNILNDNRLGGFAWGENIGWVNFGPFATLPNTQQAKFDPAAARFRGYAWGENIGWINLNDSTHFVGLICSADFNADGTVDLFDYLDFVSEFSANGPTADFNRDQVIDFFDYLDFVQAFSTSC